MIHWHSIPSITKLSIKPICFILFINMPKPSTTNINKKGDNGSPCLRPLDGLKLGTRATICIPNKLEECKEPFIHFLHLILLSFPLQCPRISNQQDMVSLEINLENQTYLILGSSLPLPCWRSMQHLKFAALWQKLPRKKKWWHLEKISISENMPFILISLFLVMDKPY